MAKKPPPRRQRRALIKELEPRLLMSADIEVVLGDPSLAAAAEGSDSGSEVERLDDPAAVSEVVSERREIVFVDTGTPGYEQLVDDLRFASTADRNFEVFLLDGERDGVEQITEILNDFEDLDAVHVVSHGSVAGLTLGRGWLCGDTLY